MWTRGRIDGGSRIGAAIQEASRLADRRGQMLEAASSVRVTPAPPAIEQPLARLGAAAEWREQRRLGRHFAHEAAVVVLAGTEPAAAHPHACLVAITQRWRRRRRAQVRPIQRYRQHRGSQAGLNFLVQLLLALAPLRVVTLAGRDAPPSGGFRRMQHPPDATPCRGMPHAHALPDERLVRSSCVHMGDPGSAE